MKRHFSFIFSFTIHVLIFSIPVSMVVKPQIHEMELFVSIEDLRGSPEPSKTQRKMEKPRPYPVKEANIQAKAPQPQIKEPEIIKPTREDHIEPVREVKKEPEEEVKDEPTMIESKILEKNTGVPLKDGTIRTGLGVENQPSVSRNMAGINISSPIETRFGASIAPAFLHRELPVYPLIARRLGKEGKVLLRLTIDEKGNLLDVEALEKAGYGFTEAAIEAVKKSTFLPAKKDGKPIASRALLTVRFQLERN
ncbi:MAG: energy transducer TonB [Thermodesulfobacteriota bacterium]